MSETTYDAYKAALAERLYANFMEENLAQIAKSYGLTYEQFIGLPAKSAGRDDACETRFSEKTPEGGAITVAKWPEGYVLWHHGEIVWKSWAAIGEAPAPPPRQTAVRVRVTGLPGSGKTRMKHKIMDLLAEAGFFTDFVGGKPEDSFIVEIPNIEDWLFGIPPKVKPEPLPALTPEQFDTVKHAMGLWRESGRRIGNGTRDSYVDEILKTVFAHTEIPSAG